MSVLAVGTVAFDRIETPFGKRDRVLGGSAMYIAMAAQHLCADVRLVAVVGDDFPTSYTRIMMERGIDLEGLEVKKDGLTFAWGGRYHFDLNNRDTIYTDLNVLSTFAPKIPESYRNSKIVCLGNLDPGIQDSVMKQVSNPAIVMCDTMNYWIEKSPEKLKKTLSKVDCLVVNESEARELADHPNLFVSARAIRDMGPEILVIKKGEHGALLFVNESIFSVPAFPLEDIQDPTGAGDAFMGGFAGYLSGCSEINLDSLKNAVVCGSAVASFTVEHFGPEGLYDLSRSDIEKRIDVFRDLTAIPAGSVRHAATES